jgi:hypothetical protein
MDIKNIKLDPLQYETWNFTALLHCEDQFAFRIIYKLVLETHTHKTTDCTD